MAYGERLKALRAQKGLSEAGLAEKLGVKERKVKNWESGLTQPDFDTMCKISRALGVELSDFDDGSVLTAVAESDDFAPESSAPGDGATVVAAEEIGKISPESEGDVTEKNADTGKKEKPEKKKKREKKRRGKKDGSASDGEAYDPIVTSKNADMGAENARQLPAVHSGEVGEKRQSARSDAKKAYGPSEQVRLRRRLQASFIIAGIAAGATAAIFIAIAVALTVNKSGAPAVAMWACSLPVAADMFLFVAQAYWGGAVAGLVLAGWRVLGTSVLAFMHNEHGAVALLVLRIIWGVICLTVFAVVSLALVAIALVVSPFSFAPELKGVRRQIEGR